MQNTSADFKTQIKNSSRSFEAKITIGDRIFYNEDIVDIKIDTPQNEDGFIIGATTSQSFDLTLLNKGVTIYTTNQIKVEIGLKIGSTTEYLLMGYYNIDDVVKTDYTIKFTAFDNMIKFEKPFFSNLTYPATLTQIVNEIATLTGVAFIGTLPAYSLKKLEGFTCREVLGFIASLCGGNAVITREGKFKIVTPSEVTCNIDGNNYFDYKREETKYKVGKVSCQVDDKILSKGSLASDSMELQFENPWVTDSILTDIFNKLNGFEYLGYSMKWQGDISLDVGDIITCTDVKGVVRKLPILSQKLSYTGGLTSEIGAKGESKNKNSFNSSNPVANKLNRVVTELLIVNEALINKANIQDLVATNAEIQNLKAKDAQIDNALINKATIEQLNATNANIQNLVAEDAKINQALINKADITQLNAVSAKIGVLEADSANVKNLLAGNLTSSNIQAGGITSDKLTIANGFITNAMIANLDVAKINAGDISTSKFRITSSSGNMLIADNTIQIKDSTRVRVQIGKDASNDYNMYVWDSTGKLMFDATGLKADGIKNKIIRDDMISDTANISGGKLNISSVVTSINAGTTTINSSKVLLDGTNQTLDLSFNSLKTEVQGIQVGGRNLFVISDCFENYALTWAAGTNYKETGALASGFIEYLPNQQYSFNYNVAQMFIYDENNQALKGVSNGVLVDLGTQQVSTKSPFIMPVVANAKYFRFSFRGNFLNGGSALDKKVKFEKGNKPTDWTPAPEDTDQAINDVKEITTSQSTTISVMQGQITTAINNTQIVKDGQTILLKDDYNRTVVKVDSISSTIGTHTSQIDAVTGKVTNVETTVNTVQRDLEGTKSTVSSHTTQINGLSSTVSNQGSSITQLQNQISLKVEQKQVETIVNGAVNNIQIGGKNLVLGSSTSISNGSYNIANYNLSGNTVGGQTYVFSLWGTLAAGKQFRLYFGGGYNHVGYLVPKENGRFELMFTMPSTVNGNGKFDQINLYSYPSTVSGTSTISKVKLEVGNKATDWTPAPEDVDVSIKTVSDKAAALEVNLNSITQRVSSTESTTSTLTTQMGQVDGKITNAAGQAVSEAVGTKDTRRDNQPPSWYFANYPKRSINEFKIASSIGLPHGSTYGTVNTMVVWSDKSGGYPVQTWTSYGTPTYQRTGTSESAWGAWVQQEDVNGSQNKANTALNDSKNYTNVEVTKTNNKVASIETNLNSITSRVSTVETTTTTINGNVTNLQSRMNTAEQKITATAITNSVSEALNNGTASINTVSTVLDRNGLTVLNGALIIKNKSNVSTGYITTAGLFGSDSGFAAYTGGTMTHFTGEVIYKSPVAGKQSPLFIESDDGINFLTSTKGGGQGVYFTPISASCINLDGKAWGTPTKSYIRASDFETDQIDFYNQYKDLLMNVKARNGIFASLSVSGSKNCVQVTEHFGDRLINAYETAEYYFGDIGSGKLINGKCIISVDQILRECINTSIGYHVFLSKCGKGDIWVSEKTSSYFVVEGTADIEFSWELKGKRKGFENARLELHNNELDTIVENTKYSEAKEFYVDLLTSRQDLILLGGSING